MQQPRSSSLLWSRRPWSTLCVGWRLRRARRSQRPDIGDLARYFFNETAEERNVSTTSNLAFCPLAVAQVACALRRVFRSARGRNLRLEEDVAAMNDTDTLQVECRIFVQPELVEAVNVGAGEYEVLSMSGRQSVYCALQMNEWADSATYGAIPRIMYPFLIDDYTRSVCLALVCARINWREPFTEEVTEERFFDESTGHSMRCTMMHALRRMDVAVANPSSSSSARYRMCLLPLNERELELAVAIPRSAEESLTHVMASLARIERWSSVRTRRALVRLHLPQVHANVDTHQRRLMQAFRALRNPHVNEMRMRIAVAWDCRGGEGAVAETVAAAAATGVIDEEFYVNRSFVYVLLHYRRPVLCGVIHRP